MPKLILADLDRYSRSAVRLLLARFPRWEEHASVTPRPDGVGNTVEFNVPCPSSGAEAGLWVSTACEELSVGFHTHHRHFTNYENRTNVAQIEAGLEFAAAIVEDRTGVLSYYIEDEFAGSRSIALPHEGPLPSLYAGMEALTSLARTANAHDKVTLRSWSGRFDRDEMLET